MYFDNEAKIFSVDYPKVDPKSITNPIDSKRFVRDATQNQEHRLNCIETIANEAGVCAIQ